MGKSSQLRVRDIALAHPITGECRELWADPPAWRQHLVAGASQLTGMAVAHYCEFRVADRRAKPSALCHADFGWRDESARRAYQIHAKAHPNAFKFFPGSEQFLPALTSGRPVAAFRAEMCGDADWYRS